MGTKFFHVEREIGLYDAMNSRLSQFCERA